MKNDLKTGERLTAKDIIGDISSQDVTEWTQLATAMMRSGKYQEAVDMLYVAIQCDPDPLRRDALIGLPHIEDADHRLGTDTSAQLQEFVYVGLGDAIVVALACQQLAFAPQELVAVLCA